MGLNSKIHLAVDALGMPVGLTVTSGTVADSSQTDKLISDIEAQYLLVDRAYDTNSVLDFAHSKSMKPVIPPREIVRNTIKRYMKTVTRWRKRF